jgi:hypothetical protein
MYTASRVQVLSNKIYIFSIYGWERWLCRLHVEHSSFRALRAHLLLLHSTSELLDLLCLRSLASTLLFHPSIPLYHPAVETGHVKYAGTDTVLGSPNVSVT